VGGGRREIPGSLNVIIIGIFSLSFSTNVRTSIINVPSRDIKTVGAILIGIVAFLCIGITSSIE